MIAALQLALALTTCTGTQMQNNGTEDDEILVTANQKVMVVFVYLQEHF